MLTIKNRCDKIKEEWAEKCLCNRKASVCASLDPIMKRNSIVTTFNGSDENDDWAGNTYSGGCNG